MARVWLLVAAALICAGCIPVCDRETICQIMDTRICDGVMLRPCDGSAIGDVLPCLGNQHAVCGLEGWHLVSVVPVDGGAALK